MKRSTIAVIGGANIEYIIKSQSQIKQGAKNFVDIEEYYGGSGLNYSLRLMSIDKDVFPLLYLGDDSIGHNIQQYILKNYTLHEQTKSFISDSSFFIKDINTIKSMIIVEGEHRTILAHDHNEKNLFFTFLKDRIKQLPNISSVMIGHIHSDRSEINPNRSTLSTLHAIKYFSSQNKFIYCNFGSAQIDYGFEFWKNSLKSIDFLQLNAQEAKDFYKKVKITPSLTDIVDSLMELNISGIITLDKFGAVGFIKNKKNKIFLARSIGLGESFVDSTGAGDAFCAGMVSALNGKKNFTVSEFKTAMAYSRSSAMYACRFYGGANKCPTKDQIDSFHHAVNDQNEVLEYKDDRMLDILELIDTTIN